MKKANQIVEQMRDRAAELAVYGEQGAGNNGVFLVPFPNEHGRLACVASDGGGWDHVSVSLPDRCPTWEEMAHVKRLFFDDDEPAFQIFPRLVDYVDQHPFTLHWWRCQSRKFPTPPAWMVGGDRDSVPEKFKSETWPPRSS